MTTLIRLLGSPHIEQDGHQTRGLKGRKAWGLLAYLALASRPVSRQRLCELLFEDADDPRGALRWNLAELRRGIGITDGLSGDPVTIGLGPDVTVDVHSLASPEPAEFDVGFRGELLEGLSFDNAPSFESWISLERQRIAAAGRALDYRQAVELLALGAPEDAVVFARRAVEADPLDADFQTALVSSLVRSGAHEAARYQVARYRDWFRREAGVEPPAFVEAALGTPAAASMEMTEEGVRSLLEVADSALSAGAATVGIGQIRRALAGTSAGNTALQALVRLQLASAMIHTQGGRGAEVLTLLHEALTRAEIVGDRSIAAAAAREIAFVAVQNGHSVEVERLLARAEGCSPDPLEQARILCVRGMALTDAGRYGEAIACLDEAITICPPEHARQVAWCMTLTGRALLLQGDAAQAAETLDRALVMVKTERWTSVQALPEALRAEAAIMLGDTDLARSLLDHAWILATEVNDQCWIATVSLGQATLVRQNNAEAMQWCLRGLSAAPWYKFFRARLLELAAQIAPQPDQALAYANELEQLAAAGGMTDLARRALTHRDRLAASLRQAG